MSNLKRQSIVLIGMPNSGKTSCGRILSRILNMPFVDTDALIARKIGKNPAKIVAEDGLEAFLSLQERIILEMDVQSSIISTGGAVIYSNKAMLYLGEFGKIIYLQQELNVIESRFSEKRQLARKDGKSLKEVFEERLPLYQKYANFIINCSNKDAEVIANHIVKVIKCS